MAPLRAHERLHLVRDGHVVLGDLLIERQRTVAESREQLSESKRRAEASAWNILRTESEIADRLEKDGIGVIIGMQFRDADVGYAVSQGLFSRGVLIGGTLFNALTLRMQPPAIITYEQMDQVLERLEETLAEVRVHAERGELVAH